MKLPNGDRAYIGMRKLADYCLSQAHLVGKDKAVLFQKALALMAEHIDLLKSWLLLAAHSIEAEPGITDEYGIRIRIDFEARTVTGAATLRSAWMIRTGEDFPRLVTCYVLQEEP